MLLMYFFFPADDKSLYESLKDYIMTEEKLIESNYPVQHPEKPGCAALFADNKKGITDRKFNKKKPPKLPEKMIWSCSSIITLEGELHLC